MTANSWRTCAIAAEESRCFASSDTSGANRTAPEEEDGLTTPGPGPREREGGRHRGMCVVPSSCKRGGLLQWFAVFTANTATPSFRVTPPNLVGPLQPPPCSRKTPKSLITRAHTQSPACGQCLLLEFLKNFRKAQWGWDESGWRGLIQSRWPCTLSTCWPITVNGALKTTKIRQGLCGP